MANRESDSWKLFGPVFGGISAVFIISAFEVPMAVLVVAAVVGAAGGYFLGRRLDRLEDESET